MRCMVIMKANKDSEAGILPDEKLLTEMMKYNEALVKAGIMLAGEGLHPSSKGARVKFSGGKQRFSMDLYRNEGVDCWILAMAGEVAGRGDRVGQALPQSSRRNRKRDRDSPGIRGRGFWGRIHAGAQGARRATARRGRAAQ